MAINKWKVMDICCRIESMMADIYRTLAEAHASDPDLESLWRKTALEEDNHAAQFKMSPRSMDCMVECAVIDEDKASMVLEACEKGLESIRARPPSPVDALKEAIRLESVLDEFHMVNAVRFTDEGSRRLFQSMMAADRDHVEALKTALEARTGKAANI